MVDQMIRRPTTAAGSFAAYRLAAVCVAGAFCLRLLLGVLDHDASPFTTLYPAILFAALWGGARAGIFAAVLGGTLAWWAFFDPRFTLVPPLTFGKQLSLAIYLLASLVIVAGADYCRRLAESLEKEQQLRNLAVQELGHRLKNKVATIQAIIAYQLRGHDVARDAILQRMKALSSADTLIEAANGHGAFIQDVIAAELGPYDDQRVSINGPSLFMPPNLTLMLALVFHELATNAAKYGALSHATGQVSIFWSIASRKLTLGWQETGGPMVAPPIRTGFGTRLLSRALKPFDGTVESEFAPTGLICRMKVSVPVETFSIPPAIIAKSQMISVFEHAS